jgi:hypothetical protein
MCSVDTNYLCRSILLSCILWVPIAFTNIILLPGEYFKRHALEAFTPLYKAFALNRLTYKCYIHTLNMRYFIQTVQRLKKRFFKFN